MRSRWTVAFRRRWVRLWLAAYPRGFRKTLGADLAGQYLSQAGDRPAHGRLSTVRVAWELCRGGLGARLDDARIRADAWRTQTTTGAGQDVRQGLRMLRRQPGSSAAILLTLAVSAGLATATFAIYDATLVRALPYPAAERIVSIGSTWIDSPHSSVSTPEYLDYRARASSLSHIALYRTRSVNLTDGGGPPERVEAAQVTASFFDVFELPAAHGRVFGSVEDTPGADRVAVIGHGLWTRRFGAKPSVVGSVVQMNDQPVRVVGVMPAALAFPERETEIWLPLQVNPAAPGGRGAHNRQVVARLADAVSIETAASEMAAIGRSLGTENPDNYPAGSGWGVSVLPLRSLLVGDLRRPLVLLVIAVLFVVLVASANVSGLFLARAAERQPELATRMALGATRGRLVRQAVTEGVVVGLAGGALALPVSAGLLALMGPSLPPAVVRPDLAGFDPRVVMFALTVTGLATVGAVLAATLGGRPGQAISLESGGRTTSDRARQRVRAAIVVAEVGLACVLLIGAGLAVQSFWRLVSIDPGLSTDHVATAGVAVPDARYPDSQDKVRFFDQVLASLEAAPGVAAAGAISRLPLGGDTEDFDFGVEGYVEVGGIEPNAQTRIVAGRYFDVMRVPILTGRDFNPRDRLDAPPVVIVSQQLAEQYWPDGEALGRRVKIWGADHPGPWREIVGIVGDVRHRGLAQPLTPTLYLPASQYPLSDLALVVRGNKAVISPALLRDRIQAVDPTQPLYDVRDMDGWLARSLAPAQFSLRLLSLFGASAIVLAALGIYGIMSFVVAGRRREFGVRLALGAGPSSLTGLVVRYGARLVGFGLVLGLTVAAWGSQYLAVTLHDVRPLEPAAFAGAVLLLMAVALTACVVPALRTRRLDPLTALRTD